jgi:SLT domain-containing protein
VLIFVMGVLWRATIWALVAAWRAVSAGLRAAWNAVWRGMAFVARAIWAGLRAAWRGVVFAFTIIWRAVSGALRVAWGAVWRGMSAAARAIWNGLRAAWNAVKNFFVRVARVLGTGVLFAWRALWRIAGAVGRGVWNGLRTAWNAVKNFFVRVGRILGAGVLFAWRALWRIAKAVGLGVWNFLRRAWNFVKNVFVRVARALGSGVLFVWRALWRIAKAVGLAVWGFLRRAWNFVKNVFIRVARVLGAGVLFVWRALWRIVRAVSIAVWNFLKRAWNGVKNFFIRIARILWNGIRGLFAAGSRWLRTTFWNPVRNFFTRTVPNAFKAAVKAISKAWNALKKAISKPVKAVVDVVYNNGIVKLWNAVAGAFGAPKLKSFKFKGFQEGGYTGNGPANEVAGVVHRGEYVIPKDQYKQMGQKKNLHGGQAGAKGMGPQVLQGMMDGTFSEKSNSMHGLGTRAAAGGRGGGDIAGMYKNEFNKPVRGAGGGPVDDGFDPGGFFGGIGDFFKSIGSSLVKAFSVAAGWSAKALKALGGLVLCSIAPVVNPMIQKTADMGKGVVNKAIPGAPMMQKLFSGSKKSSKKVEGNVTGQGMIQLAANAAKDWVTAHDICEGCGFQEFRPWRAGDGKREGNLDHRTRLMLAMARKNGFKGSVTQGSWSHAGASAGTHAGGGAMDTSPPSNKNVGALRSAGFAAWNRGAKWGSASFAPHTHSIAVGNHNLSPAAAQQVRDFKAGKNGLAGGGKDNFKDGSCSGKAGNCNSYRGMAAKALAANGLGGARNLSKFMTQMKKESGCNPRARNGWDSNAKAGNASVGLMQVIPTTFRANHCPGTSNNIYDPYANICASARYQKRRYGTVNGTPYRSGTRSATAGWHKVGENGPEMVRFAGGETVRTASQTRRSSGGTVTVEAKDSSGGDVHVHIHGDVYAKSSMEFERMLSGAMQNLKRKGRLPK